jgi:hypothetical protein
MTPGRLRQNPSKQKSKIQQIQATMSSKPLPPPPKMSGLTTPANATSSVFTTPSGSSHITSRYNYPTPAAGARVAATTRPAGAASSARGASASSVSTKVAVPPPPPQQQHSVSYETFAPRTAELRYRLARLAALTAGPCFGDSHFGPQSEQKVKVVEDGSGTSTSNSTTSTGVTLAEAMRPPKLSTMKSVHSRNNGSTTTTTSSSVDDIIHKTLESTLLTTTKLNSLIQHTSSLRIALHTSLTIANDVTQRHSDLLKHSGELSAAAERLQHEEQILTRRATEVGLPLKHYDAVDRLGVLVGVLFKDGGRVIVRTNAKLHVDNNVDEFMEVLEQIDDAIEFFGESSGGSGGADNKRRERLSKKDQGYESTSSGSAEYYRRACALQDAALELLRVGVADRITQTRTQIQDALTLPRVPIAADKLEASLVYTRFHGISKRSNALISIARKRLDKLGNQSVAATSYEDLLTLCRNTYCGAREALLTSTVRTHMDILRERHGLVGMTRLASVFLIRLCTIETAMYLDFFGDAEKKRYSQKKTKRVLLDSVDEEKSDSDAVTDGEEKGAGDESENSGNISQAFQRKGSSSSHPGAAALTSQIISEDATFRDAEFQSMLGALCSALHRTIRRGLVSVLDLDVLCQVVSVLREERSAANSSPTTLAAARAVSGVIQDAQERLIFCANDALHKEVVRFKPTTNDLNYPGKLLGEKPKVAIIIDGESNAPVDAETSESKPDSAGDAAELSPIDDAFAAQQRVYDSWFPPMRSVLRILSKIFRVVEPRVFEDIALQSVQSCTKSLKDGSIFILKKSGQIHADLFLVKHLLVSYLILSSSFCYDATNLT